MKFGSTVALVALGLSRLAWADPKAEAVAGSLAAQELGASQLDPGGEQDKAKGVPSKKTLPFGSSFEVTGGTNGLFTLSDVSTQISMFAEARYRFTSRIQLGGSFAYRYQSANGVSDSAFQGLVGPTINFGLAEDGGLQSAFFASLLVGFTTGQTSFGNVVINSATEPTVAASVGKRFAITHHIAYAPSVGVVKELNFDPSFTFQPISISIFF